MGFAENSHGDCKKQPQLVLSGYTRDKEKRTMLREHLPFPDGWSETKCWIAVIAAVTIFILLLLLANVWAPIVPR